jgi:hypothetical protein
MNSSFAWNEVLIFVRKLFFSVGWIEIGLVVNERYLNLYYQFLFDARTRCAVIDCLVDVSYFSSNFAPELFSGCEREMLIFVIFGLSDRQQGNASQREAVAHSSPANPQIVGILRSHGRSKLSHILGDKKRQNQTFMARIPLSPRIPT